jgi:hypothetical protein
MSDDDKIDWLDKKQGGRETPNAEHYGVDRELVNKQHQKGRAAAERHAPSTVTKAKYYSVNAAKTGVSQGVKLGFQQAIGLVLCEFFQATFDEIGDVYKKGFVIEGEDPKFFNTLSKRLKKIAKRVGGRWKDAFKAFEAGFISGFLSNLVTVIINTFVKTGKRIVRVIREGFFSLLRAMSLLCCPPEGMTFEQAAHEASKLIAAGLTVIAGISIEQYVDTLIKGVPLLEPLSDLLTVVLIGATTGLATTFIVYAIDKIDFFNVNDAEKHHQIVASMESSLNAMFGRSEVILGNTIPV